MAALLRDCFLRLEPWSLQRVQSVKLSVKATSMSVSLQNCFCCLIMLRMQPTQSMILSVKIAPRSRGTAVQNCFERWKTWKLQQLQSLEACFQCVPFAKASVRNCQISFQKDLSLLSMAFQAFRKAVFTQREIDACLANEHCLWRHFHVFRKAPNSSSAAVADPGPNVLLKGLDRRRRQDYNNLGEEEEAGLSSLQRGGGDSFGEEETGLLSLRRGGGGERILITSDRQDL